MSAKELEEQLNKALQTRALKSIKKRSSSRRDLIPLLNTKDKDKDKDKDKEKDKDKDKEGSLTSRRSSKVIIKDEKKDKSDRLEDSKEEPKKSGPSKYVFANIIYPHIYVLTVYVFSIPPDCFVQSHRDPVYCTNKRPHPIILQGSVCAMKT